MEISKEIIERVKELNPTVCIKQAKETDADAFVNLFNIYYKRKTSKAYFNWQFFESPFASALFMAFDGDKLIGYYGIKIYPLTNNSNAGFAIDFLIDETHRKKGIAFLLDEQVIQFCNENKAGCLTALPNAFGNAAFKALGFKSIIKVDTLLLDTLNRPVGYVEPLIIANENGLQIGFKKDESFRHWRFDLNPLYKYKKVSLNDNCFAITKIFTDPVSKESFGDIVDIHFDSLNIAFRLVDKVVAEMVLQNVKAITIWALPHTHLYNGLTTKGFLKQTQERYFCVKPLTPEFENLASVQLWNLVEADAEIY